MKRITFLLFMSLLSFCGYAQLAPECFEDPWTPVPAATGAATDWLTLDNGIGTAFTWVQQDHSGPIPSFEGTVGTHSAYIDKENVGAGTFAEDLLVTPEFTMPVGGVLTFQSKLTTAGVQGSIYRVYILPEDADAADIDSYISIQEWTESQLAISPILVWEEKTLTFGSAYDGQSVRIAFSMIGDNFDRWQLDCVSVTEPCGEVENLTAGGIGLDSAELEWDNPGGATSWEIEIIPEGDVPTGHGIIYNGVLPYEATGTATGDPLVQAPFVSNTGYKYYVKAICDDGGESDWVGAFFFQTVGLGDTCSAPLVVNDLPFSDTDNTANYADEYNGFPGSGCGNSTWEDYLGGNDVVYEFTPDFTGTVSVDLSNNGPNSGVFVYEDCDDIGSDCFDGGVGGWEGNDVSLEFEVTANETYYVVISTYSNQTTDYTLIIQQVFCDEPVGLDTTNLGMTTASLSWTNPGGATSWQVQVQPVDTGIPSGAGEYTANTNTNWPVPTADLTASTAYEYYVRANCGDGTFSAWAGPYYFNTAICEVADQCTYTFNMWNQWGGTWNLYTMDVIQNGIVVATLTGPETWGMGTVSQEVQLCDGFPFELYWNTDGNWPTEIGVSIENSFAQPIFTKNPGTGSPGETLYSLALLDCDTPMCLPPTGLTASNPTLTTIDLAWDGPATGDWEYYIVEAGDPAPTDASTGTLTSTNPTVGAGPLEAATEYEYYVRMICEDATSDHSEWAGPFPFSSSVCDPAEKCEYTFLMKSDWWAGWQGGYMTISQGGVTVDEIGAEFTTGQTMEVTVMLCHDEPIEIFWSSGGGWQGQMGLDVINQFDQTFFSMPFNSNGVGTTIYEGDADCLVPLCLPPTGLTASNPTLTTIDLGWDGPATGEWEYYIVEAGDPAPGDDTEGTVTTTNPAIGAGPLEASTEYEYYVRMICDGASTPTSEWAGPFFFSSSVCDPDIKCDYTFVLYSSWWSGWQGGYMTIRQNNTTVAVIGPEFITGESMEVTIPMCHDIPVEVTWDNGGGWAGQMGLDIVNGFEQTIFSLPMNNDGSQVGDVIFEGEIDCENPACLAPSGLYADNETMTTIDLGWDGPATGAWEYYIVEAGEPAPDDTTPGTATANNPTVGAPLPNPATNYEYYVRLVCEATDDLSPWAGPFAMNSAVCDPDDQCIYTFEMTHDQGWGYQNNQMVITQGGVPVATIGNEFTWGESMTVEVPLCPDVPIEVTWIGGWSTDGIGLTIFTPYDEDQYVMPDSAEPGLIYSGSPTCDPPTCPKPQNIEIANISNTSADISWDEIGSATQWEIFLVAQGEPGPAADAEGIIANSNPYTLTEGVEPGVDYDVYVRAVCAEDDKSLWTGPEYFQSSLCELADQCTYTVTMSSTYMWDDGWVGDTMDIVQGGVVVATLTGPSMDNNNEDVVQTLHLCSGIPFTIHWNNNSGSWNMQYIGISVTHDYENAVVFDMPPGTGADVGTGDIFTSMVYCSEITCPWPTELGSFGYNLTAVLLDWEPAAAENEWDLYIQEAGGAFPQGVEPTANVVGESSYLAEGLTEGVFYEYYVRAICGPDDESYWYGPFFFNIFMPDGCSIEVADPENPDLGTIINGQEYVICPGDEVCVDLEASYLKTGTTTEYIVEEIPYDPPYPFSGGTSLNVETDDIWSGVIDLPFNFCFYGETYNECIVGSNGVISFDTANANGGCPWSYSASIPTPGFPILNAIYGPYQDIFPIPTQGEINYQILGSYPCRALVVNYYEVPQFSCGYNTAEGGETSQMVLYEVTNTIEVYVGNRVPCDSWNGGNGVIGIQNADGTEAVVPDGYNTGNWEAHEVAFRFIPDGESNVEFEWIEVVDDVETVLSTEDLIEFCAEEPSTLIARATYTNCDGEEYVKESRIVVRQAEEIIADEANDITVCAEGTETTVDLDESVEGIVDNMAMYNFAYYLTEEAAELGGTDAIPADYVTGSGSWTIWVRIERNNEPCHVLRSFVLTVNTVEAADQLPNVVECDSYTLPELTNGNYFTGEGGTGVQLNAGQVLNSNQTVWVFNESNTIPNCTSETSFTVTIIPTPQFNLGGPYVVCDAANATVSVSATNFNLADATFVWTVEGVPSAETGSSIVGTAFGTYEVTVTVGDCSSTLSVEVTQDLTPVAVAVDDYCEDNIYKLDAQDVEGSFDPAASSYAWTGPNGFTANTQVIDVPELGTYNLTVTTSENCVGVATFEVLSTSCFIQRGISPNGDGDNDYFDLSTLDVEQLSIFNRYGQEVYSKSNYTIEWHGQSDSGDELPTGTYFYMIQRSNGEQITGWIYINREE